MTTAQKTPPDVDAAAAVEVIGGTEDPGGVRVSDGLMALARAATRSGAALKAGLGLSVESVKIALGRSEVAPAKGDNRFADPTWTDNPGYRRLKQGYLAWSAAVDSVVEAGGRRLAHPGAGPLRGRDPHVVAGADEHAAGQPGGAEAGHRDRRRQPPDRRPPLRRRPAPQRRHAEAGRPERVHRWARTWRSRPGAVVFRNEVFELLQYQPTTPTVRTRPVLMVPPPINKYYFLDLAPGRSFIEHAVAQGLQFFVISWRNPRKEHAGWDLDTYGQAVLDAIDATLEITGSDSRQRARDVRRRDHHLRRPLPPGRSGGRAGQLRVVRGDAARLGLPGHGRRLPVAGAAGGGPAPVPQRRRPRRPVAGGRVHLDAAQRTGVELLGQQLPDGQRAAGLRHPGLERRQDEPARRAPRPVPRHLRRQPRWSSRGPSRCSARPSTCRR